LLIHTTQNQLLDEDEVVDDEVEVDDEDDEVAEVVDDEVLNE
jgi:hypothetical protein